MSSRPAVWTAWTKVVRFFCWAASSRTVAGRGWASAGAASERAKRQPTSDRHAATRVRRMEPSSGMETVLTIDRYVDSTKSVGVCFESKIKFLGDGGTRALRSVEEAVLLRLARRLGRGLGEPG